LADYKAINTAINTAIGHMVASMKKSEDVDAYNVFASLAPRETVGYYLKSHISPLHTSAAYQAL
jgi:Peridinin-chlorophyll A binding protein